MIYTCSEKNYVKKATCDTRNINYLFNYDTSSLSSEKLIEVIYDTLLSETNPVDLYDYLNNCLNHTIILEEDGKNNILRFILGAWFDIKLGIPLYEISFDDNGHVLYTDPEYEKIRDCLENYIVSKGDNNQGFLM